MSNYGYVRVSSKDQNEARQIDAMEKAGIPKDHLFVDKASGKDFDRKQYVKMIYTLREGDVLFVQAVDRLGRNYEAILNEWNAITKKIGADIVVLDMPILDTRKEKSLTGTLVFGIVLQLLSYVAQTEREHIKERQRQGIEAARKRGVHLGRQGRPLPENFFESVRLWESGEITQQKAAEMCGMPNSSFRYRLKALRGD